jgi:hypothetical protein
MWADCMDEILMRISIHKVVFAYGLYTVKNGCGAQFQYI